MDEIPEEEIDSILDWYDQALANGQGFKSEEEREAYFAEIGDPLKHPLWAESMEDLEGNPMVDAFRLLREEDKTKVELVLMYKDEGNEFIRKKTTKERHEAIKRYSYSLTLLDNADLARKDGTEDEKDKGVNLHHLRSQIYNNRALALMQLKNYGLAIKDLSMALLYQNENIKAHYRKSKCLFQLKKYELALKSCEVGLSTLYTHLPDDKDSEKEFLILKGQCEKEIERLNRLRKEIEDKNRANELLWKQAWEIASRNNVKLGPCPKYWKSPPQLLQHIPFYTSPPTDLSENWPMIVLYPQYSQIDVIQGTSAETMLVMLLAEMFPEDEGNGLSCVEWDKKGEYYVSNLIVFVQLNMAEQYHDEVTWLQHRIQREKKSNDDDNENNNENNHESKDSSNFNPSYHMELLEIHLGCTIQQILTAPNHILAGGVLSLTVFPKNSQALKLFLKQYNNSYKILQPNGVVSEKNGS